MGGIVNSAGSSFSLARALGLAAVAGAWVGGLAVAWQEASMPWGLGLAAAGGAFGAQLLAASRRKNVPKSANPKALAVAWGALGSLLVERRDLGAAELLLSDCLALHARQGNLEGVAWASGLMGNIRKEQGDFANAESSYWDAIKIYDSLGQRENAAYERACLGTIQLTRGDLDGAEARLREALKEYESLDAMETDEAAGLVNNLGVVEERRGNLQEAKRLWGEARDIYARLGNDEMAERVNAWMSGDISSRSGDPRFGNSDDF